MELNSKCPSGPIETRWERHRFQLKLVNPANKRKYEVLVVGGGLPAPPLRPLLPTGLPREVLLLPGFAAARASHRKLTTMPSTLGRNRCTMPPAPAVNSWRALSVRGVRARPREE